MKDKLMQLSAKLQVLLLNEEGQDLIEYALVAAIIALGLYDVRLTWKLHRERWNRRP